VVGWAVLGLGTAGLGILVLYWGEVKRWFKRRRSVVVSEQIPVNPKSVEEVIKDALVWAGCHRYLYRSHTGETGIIWAPSRESAGVNLDLHERPVQELIEVEIALPTEHDLIVYEEGV
jgi:hypothetical protein